MAIDENNALANLLASLRSSRDVLELIEALAVECRQSQHDHERWLGTFSHLGDADQYLHQLTDAYRQLDTDFEEVGPLVDLLQIGQVPVHVRTCTLLKLLQQEFTATIHQEFESRGRTELGANRIMPVLRPPIKGFVKQPSTKPESRPQLLGYTPELALTPVDMHGHQVGIDFCNWVHLERFAIDRGRLLLGVGVLNHSEEDMHWETSKINGVPSFWQVRPKPEVGQLERARRVIRRAMEQKVDVLVLPELCLDEADEAKLADELQSFVQNSAIVVLGSVHRLCSNGHRRNASRAWIGGQLIGEHFKLERFPYTDPKTNICYWEQIETSPRTVNLFMGGRWSLAMLICRDLVSEPIQLLMKQLRPSMLLVPSFSHKAMPYVSPMAWLAEGNQSYGVVANGPVLDPERVVAVFARPSNDGVIARVMHQVHEPNEPFLFLFDSQDGAQPALPC